MFDDLFVLWSGLQPSIQAALIGAAATITAATMGALVVARQIRKQAANAIRQNSHNESLKLKMKVYEEIIGVVQKCQDATSALSTFIRLFSISVQKARLQIAIGQTVMLPNERFLALMELQKAFSSSAIDMVFLTERWQIIDPRIEIFRTAFNATMHDVREASTAYEGVATYLMPVDRPDGLGVFPWSPPADPQFALLENASKALIETVELLGSFAYDFQNEMQNLLVGELFGNQISSRIPIDPRQPVVRLENHTMLDAYFNKDTPWGRNRTKIEAEVRESFQVPSV